MEPNGETQLVELQDSDFDWLLDGSRPAQAGLSQAPGGIDDPAVLDVIRRMTRRVREAGHPGAWMIIANQEVVGLCSYKAPPVAGRVEIGYGIAASRRNRGHASVAVRRLVEATQRDSRLTAISAETVLTNLPSERVLEKNGFRRIGRRQDPDEGCVTVWELTL